jgi:enoyl-CoA hydratase/carnithine racemase
MVLIQKIQSNNGIIAYVIFNRPTKHNALNMDMFLALRRTIVEIHHDPTMRAVIVSGSGKSFCTGLDVTSMFNPTNIMQAQRNIQTLLQRPYQPQPPQPTHIDATADHDHDHPTSTDPHTSPNHDTRMIGNNRKK